MNSVHVGLISGTSMDGIDAVAVELNSPRPRLIASLTQAHDPGTLKMLDRLRQDPDQFPLADLGRLDAELGDAFAEAALKVIESAGMTPGQVEAIGSHGQTVLHRADRNPPHTLQIGDPARIAEQTGIVTVADFRRADVAAGGQGAPLAPLIHQAFLSSVDECRVVINLGGIANLTRLHPRRPVSGFDTGPANCFLDLWYRRHHDERFDPAGRWASGGQVDPVWLEQLLEDDYFRKTPPKSTGIEYFSERWLDQRLPDWSQQRPQDIQATLAEFTAASLAQAIRLLGPDGVLLCGGGVHNSDLCERLINALPGFVIAPTDDYGMPADQIEAVLFAWLARERLAERRLDTVAITGASRPVHLGVVHQP